MVCFAITEDQNGLRAVNYIQKSKDIHPGHSSIKCTTVILLYGSSKEVCSKPDHFQTRTEHTNRTSKYPMGKNCQNQSD